jgi:hypothetical protein
LDQLYAALKEMEVTEKLASMRPATGPSPSRFAFDFSKIENPATAANRASLLINNIACLKDHLHAWCKLNGMPLTGDLLINSNREVAIVHDLWNLDKHAELNRPSRSGLSPRFSKPAHTTLEFKIDTTNETPLFTFSVFDGRFQAHQGANARITATVIDKDGNTLGDIESICLIAVAAWEAEFVKAGLKIVPPPERQSEYARLSAELQAIGIRFRPELPCSAASLLMTVRDRVISVGVYDRSGKQIAVIPDESTTHDLRTALEQTFRTAISPDHDGVIALI